MHTALCFFPLWRPFVVAGLPARDLYVSSPQPLRLPSFPGPAALATMMREVNGGQRDAQQQAPSCSFFPENGVDAWIIRIPSGMFGGTVDDWKCALPLPDAPICCRASKNNTGNFGMHVEVIKAPLPQLHAHSRS